MTTTPYFGSDRVVASVRNVEKRFGSVDALTNVSFDIHEHRIHGLLGRNGAGKTTMMQILTGQAWQDRGEVQIFGEAPFENAAVMRNVCFVAESQKYPEDFKVKHVLRAASRVLQGWDDDFARELLSDFDVPESRKVKKLSRGMLSALGVAVGLASRAPLTFLDEPYLGLDAVSRQRFYDRLLEDYSAHPRTIVLSTHLIDEVSDLIDRVIVIDGGTVVVDDDAENLRGRAVTVSGAAGAVERLTAGRTVLHHDSMGAMARSTVIGPLTDTEIGDARSAGVVLEPVSLQQYVVHSTTTGRPSTRKASIS